jgi:RNA polymerase sigma-70 factor (ECF subfamily)
MMPDDTDLVLAAQKGDPMAFEQLVNRYDQQVLAIALSYTNHSDDAKDVYQEVFIRVYRALPGFRFESKFSTWLHKITTNVCLTFKSRNRRHTHLSIDQGIEQDDGSSYALSDVLADDSTPDRQILNSEISEQVQEAIKSLSPQQKMVFSLKHFQGYKLREIAQMMDCAEGTVKKHLFVAHEKLRERLKEFL